MADKYRYIDPNGTAFAELPSKWHNISPFTWDVASQHHWIKEYVPPVPTPEPLPRTTCTKYELIGCLSEFYPGLLETLRAAYEESADLRFYWNTVIQLDRNNADFKVAVGLLDIDDDTLDEIFAKIEPVEA